ncbi:hypothetical protein Tco_0941302 [Tanacetum coccineum]|uniref:Uncharacterized protein n=1 Tax=Tanacetum coccineum TaxID=301880 RepID=A0ABQ5DR68_9ASTR
MAPRKATRLNPRCNPPPVRTILPTCGHLCPLFSQTPGMIDEVCHCGIGSERANDPKMANDSHYLGNRCNEEMNVLFGMQLSRLHEMSTLILQGTEGCGRIDLTYGLRGWKPVFRDRMFPVETDKLKDMLEELTLLLRDRKNKRKFEDTPRNNQNQQPNKRQNTAGLYAAGNGDKKPYEGTNLYVPV